MKNNRELFSFYGWLLICLLIAFTCCCLIKPLVLSVDSAYGFLAYKGTLFFHAFNRVPELSILNIAKTDAIFESWWSPGQWLVPGLLNFVFGIRLGLIAIFVTLGALVSGLLGYFRLFRFYRFPRHISLLSLLIIFSSATCYYGFVVYQGGEVLEFAVFPWFLLYVARINRLSLTNLVLTGLFFFLCFLAKTTLLLYGFIVLLARAIQLSGLTFRKINRFSMSGLWLLLPGLVCLFFIWLFFLSRGPRPSVINHFNITAMGILTPVISPLSSILSVQQNVGRGELILKTFWNEYRIGLFSFFSYVGILLLQVWIFQRLLKSREVDSNYRSIFFILYGGLAAFFLFAYSFGTNIDLNVRHFKLMGYLLAPALLIVLQEKVRLFWIQWAVLFCCLLAAADIVYLKNKWTSGRYIGESYFYRNCEPIGTADPLDEPSYRQLLAIDRRLANSKGDPFVFFVESTADIAIDLHHRYILLTPGEDPLAKVYRGDQAIVIACISKQLLSSRKDILGKKFPDLGSFKIIAETGRYWFLCSELKNRQGQAVVDEPGRYFHLKRGSRF
ncbi:MAG TPA: hypothetical protein VG890_03860 [Puia sp.]|nr:hypothetical protein [Puia sp.]